MGPAAVRRRRAGGRGAAAAARRAAGAGRLPPGGYGSLTQNDLALRVRTTGPRGPLRPARPAGHPPAGQGQLGVAPLAGGLAPRRDRLGGQHVGRRRAPAWRWSRSSARAPTRGSTPRPSPCSSGAGSCGPLGIVPFSGRFTSQQLNVREQVSAIYLFRGGPAGERLVHDHYGGQTSDDWQGKQRTLDRERARVALRSRDSATDSAGPRVAAPDTATAATPR